MRRAFTFIEVLISVVIISIVILSLVNIFSNNREMTLFIAKKGVKSFNSTLFAIEDLEKYDKSTKSAYDILYQNFEIKNDEQRKYLQSLEKNITLGDIKKIESGYGFDYILQKNIVVDSTKNIYYKIAPNSITLSITNKDKE